jgi:hypothetical protein
MQTSLEITFRGMPPSSSVEGAIGRWATRLEHACNRIQRCSVVIERPHHHRLHGNSFHVRIELTVPGRTIAVSREPERDAAHENVYLAIADAFRAARRMVQDHARIQRRETKQHLLLGDSLA